MCKYCDKMINELGGKVVLQEYEDDLWMIQFMDGDTYEKGCEASYCLMCGRALDGTQEGWNSVGGSETPKEWETVFIHTLDGEILVAHYSEDGEFWESGNNCPTEVTHWMRKPEPPKEG